VVQAASHVPLYKQIELELRRRIRAGDLEPYAQIPSEAELTEMFAVSRMTTRKAVDRLVAEGLLFRQPGKGTFVAPAKIVHGASTQLSFSAAMHSLGLNVETAVLRAGVVPAPSEVARTLTLAGDGRAVLVRRLRMVEGEPAALHTTYLPMLYASILDDDLTGSLLRLMADVGAHVTQSRDTLEVVMPTAEEAELLQIGRGTPLIRLTGIGTSSSGEPLRFTDSIYRGDRFRFSIDTSGRPDLRPEFAARPLDPARLPLSEGDLGDG
jgi:DNA-binding GntR family transcriptional regulator